MEANTIALTGVREEERVGQRTLIEVLNAQQELLNSQVNSRHYSPRCYRRGVRATGGARPS